MKSWTYTAEPRFDDSLSYTGTVRAPTFEAALSEARKFAALAWDCEDDDIELISLAEED